MPGDKASRKTATAERRSRAARSGKAARAAKPRQSIDMSPLTGLIGYMLRRAQLAVFQDFFRTFAALDIRPAQYSVLTIIERNPGLKQSQVSAALGIKRTNFVALFDTLERRGLAERRPAATDRRSHALHLTPAGAALTRKLRQLNAEHEQRFIDRIGEDGRQQLLTLLTRIAEGVEAETDDDAPVKRGRSSRPLPAGWAAT
jgi:DNA-binding MarR family transcriptional regulator